jgi:hypothetical protein
MNGTTPTFATVGAVNHGKSSVVATLAENDQVRISPRPGETAECQRFALGDLFVFFDTPGFQNAFEALPELAPAAKQLEPLQVFRDFIARHQHDPEFAAECRLFSPIVDGAGILYVVDGSRSVLEINLAEMEILRLTGQPRLAVINRTSTDLHVQDWKRRLGQHFNAVREFNAHHATFVDRIELLETLAGIEQSWKPRLNQAVTVLREEWESRMREAAEVILGLLRESLLYRETSRPTDDPFKPGHDSGAELKRRFMDHLSGVESKAHTRLIDLFSHRLVKTQAEAEAVLSEDLFSEETWRLFGLSTRQLIATAAAGGAMTGAGGDLLAGGHSLGLFALVGGVVGAGGAMALGKQRPELSIDSRQASRLPKSLAQFLPGKIQLSGRVLTVGPYRALNFPWILMDRALGVFGYVINRAHARRDQVTLRSSLLQPILEPHAVLSGHWPDADRKAWERFFAAIRKGKDTSDQREEFRQRLAERLRQISGLRIDFPWPQ